jgi:hypothetical protein
MLRRLTIALVALVVLSTTRAEETALSWKQTTWNGEQAFSAATKSWQAIVSIERARLIYFGSADGAHNLLYAPRTRNAPAGWGGHRVWLGPQTNWAAGWPPPAAWEKSVPEKVSAEGSHLVLQMADAGAGWPHLARDYFWTGGRFHCRVHATGGNRAAQIIEILQVPPSAEVELSAPSIPLAPRGYVQLHLGRHPSPQPEFPTPPHATRKGDQLVLRFCDVMDKFGFTAQPIRARIGSSVLRLDRGATTGRVVSTPDEGFVTQVYLGSGESPLIELEQLSPLFAAGGDATFEIVLDASESAH